MAASLEAQSQSLEDILSEQGLKNKDLHRVCSQAIRLEIAIRIKRWQMLGKYLEISSHILHDIEVENRTEEGRTIDLLETWHKQKGRRATYHKLLQALYRLQGRDLVEVLCGLIKKHSVAHTRKNDKDLHQSGSGEVKVVKSGQITDSDRLFNDLAVEICDKYTEVGINLGLEGKILTNELETGKFTMLQGSKKAMKMLQLWRDSVAEDDFTYSVLAAALEKQGFVRCANKHCYIYNSCVCTGKSVYTLSTGSSVEEQIKNLETRFKKYLNRLQEELNEKAISVQKLNKSLLQLPLKLKMEYDKSIEQKLPKLQEVKSIEDFFFLLDILISFIDYRLVKYFIEEFGSGRLKYDMSKYEDDMKDFMGKTTVGDIMHFWPGQMSQSDDFKNLWVKIGDDPNKYTLEKLNKMRNKHCANLKFSAILSAIVDLTPAGSFFAVWSVPTVAVEEVRMAICQVDRAFYESEHVNMIILDGKLVYLSGSTEKADLQKKNEDKHRKEASKVPIYKTATQLSSGYGSEYDTEHQYDDTHQQITQRTNKDKRFVILTAGKSGVGKSTLINNFLQLEGDAVLEARVDPNSVTTGVKHCDREVNGVQVRVIDMPALHAADSGDRTDTSEDILGALMGVTGEGVDVVFYCINLLNRLENFDIENMDTLTKAFGPKIWEHVIFVFTHTDMVLLKGSNPEELVEKYIEALRNHLVEKRQVNVEIRSIYSFTDDLEINKYNGIVGIPVSKNPAIPEKWRITLLLQVIRTCRQENIPALLTLNRIDWGEIKKSTGSGIGGVALGTAIGAGIGALVGGLATASIGGIGAVPTAAGGAAIGAWIGTRGGSVSAGLTALVTEIEFVLDSHRNMEERAEMLEKEKKLAGKASGVSRDQA